MADTFDLVYTITPKADLSALQGVLSKIKSMLSSIGGNTNIINDEQLAKDFKAVETAINSVEKEFDQLEQASASFSKSAGAGLKDVDKEVQKTATSIKQQLKDAFSGEGFKNAFAGALTGIGAASVIQTALSGVSQGFTQSIDLAKNFESTLAEVSAITGFTGESLNNMGESARELSKKFGTEATDQLNVFKGVLSKLGPQMAEDQVAMSSMADSINTLAKAGGIDATTAMEALSNSMLQFGVDTSDPKESARAMAEMMNTLAAGAQYGAAEIPQVAEAVVAAGVAAKGANLSFEETNAAIQALAMGGKFGAEAGTALRNVLGMLQNASGPAEEAMAKLGTSSGELGQILTTQGLGPAVEKLKAGMQGLATDAERNVALMDIFGTENASAAGILMTNVDAMKQLTQQVTGTNAATEQADIIMATFNERMNRTWAVIKDLGITIGTGLIGALNLLFDGFSLVGDAISVINDNIEYFLPIFLGLTGAIIAQNTAVIAATAAKSAMAVVDGILAIKTGLVTAATWAWSAALNSTGIPLIIIAIGALVAGLIYAYKHFAGFREIVDKVWGSIKQFVGVVWDSIKAFGKFLGLVDDGKKKTAPLNKNYKDLTKTTEDLTKKTEDLNKKQDDNNKGKDKATASAKKQEESLQQLIDKYVKWQIEGKKTQAEMDALKSKILELSMAEKQFSDKKASFEGMIKFEMSKEEIDKSWNKLIKDFEDGSISQKGKKIKLPDLAIAPPDKKKDLDMSEYINNMTFDGAKESFTGFYDEFAIGLENLGVLSADFFTFGDTFGEVMESVIPGAEEMQTAFSDMFSNLVQGSADAGQAVVALSFDTLASLIPTFVASIFGQSLSQLGPIAGPIVSGALTGVLYGLLSLARSAAGAYTGVVGISEQYDRVPGPSDTMPLWITPGESIITKKASSIPENAMVLEYMNETGGSFLNMPGLADKLSMMGGVSVSKAIDNSQTNELLYQLIKETKSVNRSINSVPGWVQISSQSVYRATKDVSRSRSRRRMN